ncbi:MAG: 3-phosphoshikimate 1-carboxyvinyltransferase [Pseudomonadota bacterium]
MVCTSHPVGRISGVLTAPADKSCSHRSLILGGLAEGQTEISGLLEGEDVLRTGQVMAALGAGVERIGERQWRVQGVGASGLKTPASDLDFGNSGTGSRLMMGVVAGYPISARFVGDASLSSRPMGRVLDPLTEMGVLYDAAEGQRLPLVLEGRSNLRAIKYNPPHASAQVKSCLMLAGLNAEGETVIEESRPTRDHSEKMLRGFGADISVQPLGSGRRVAIKGGQRLTGQTVRVPGDPSSVAFLAAAAILSPKGGALIENVMSNATRDGFFRAAAMMGAQIGAEEQGEAAGERLIDMSFESSPLKGIDIPDSLVPSMIDEFPILAVLAAHASGETIISGAEELRVKESDRISATVNMLRVNGVDVEERPDGMAIQGCAGAIPGGGLVETHHDHRIAMSALVMGTASQNPIRIDDASMIATSYPDFVTHMKTLGANIEQG